MSTTVLWRIAVDTPEYTADDLSGRGAEATGGRWSRKGHRLVYTSTSVALACLETAVHLRQGGLPLNRYLVEITVPAAAWDARQILGAGELPVGWDAQPEGKVSLDIGDKWLLNTATTAPPILLVPSVIVPEEFNALINPLHPLAALITGTKVRKWLYDNRLDKPV